MRKYILYIASKHSRHNLFTNMLENNISLVLLYTVIYSHNFVYETWT